MKWFTIFTISVILLSNLQAQTTNHQTSVNRISELSHLANGKYAFCRRMTTGFDGKWITGNDYNKANSSGQLNTGRKSDVPIQTYHIVFHFDKSVYMVICTNADTVFDYGWNLIWINDTTLEGDMTVGYYYFFSFMESYYPTKLYSIMVKNFHVYKDMDTTILSSSANHNVNLIAYDENGNLLVNKYRSGDGWNLDIEFPNGIKTAYASMGACGPLTVLSANLMSDFPPEVKIGWGRTDVSITLPYKDYVNSYPILPGISADTTMTIFASDYHYFPFYFYPSPEGTESYFGFGDGTCQNDSLMGYADSFVAAFVSTDYPARPTDTVKVFSTEFTVDTNKVFHASGILHVENFEKFYYITGPVMYLTSNEDLDMTCGKNYPPVTGDYLLSNGNSVVMGTSAPFNMTESFSFSNSNLIQLLPLFNGQANEQRIVDYSLGTWDLWKGDQHIYHDSLRETYISYGTMDNGKYMVMLNDSNYTLFGQQGYLQSKLMFDLGNSDPNPPTLIAFKILQGDSIHTEITDGFTASIKLTAGDFDHTPPLYYPVYHSLADIHLYYKEFHDTLWYDLPVNAQPDFFNPMSGMPYLASLQPIMNQFPDSALIDVRITLIDSAGNSMTQTIHPAFHFKNALVGSGTKSITNSCLLFPNPASETLHIGVADNQITASVYTSNGLLLMEETGSRDIDISGLKQGFYLVKIQDNITGNYSFGKFIK
ncbi:MAG: T9SS type A sorting domain-containing protein [Bacteroidales bacterium]|jgi:hypothetical protein